MVIAVVGAGGKTTLIKQYAKEYLQQGKKVFVTTSTHMYIEKDTLLTDDAEVLIRELKEKGYLMAGLPQGEKIRELSKETYEKVCRHADVVLIEADGSKHLPIKFPGPNEPVIYENVDEIIVVCGLHAIGKPAKEVAFRLELVKQCLGIEDDTIITLEHIQTLVNEGYVKPLGKAYPQKTVRVKAMGGTSDETGNSSIFI